MKKGDFEFPKASTRIVSDRIDICALRDSRTHASSDFRLARLFSRNKTSHFASDGIHVTSLRICSRKRDGEPQERARIDVQSMRIDARLANLSTSSEQKLYLMLIRSSQSRLICEIPWIMRLLAQRIESIVDLDVTFEFLRAQTSLSDASSAYDSIRIYCRII